MNSPFPFTQHPSRSSCAPDISSPRYGTPGATRCSSSPPRMMRLLGFIQNLWKILPPARVYFVMAGIRFQPEDSDASQMSWKFVAIDLISDDDRSVSADSWSIKSDYCSTLDDEQCHVEATEALSAASFRASSDYNSDRDESDSDAVLSMLGFQSYWDATYADELVNFSEHGHTSEVWFGADVMAKVASWTKKLCLELSQCHLQNHNNTNHLTVGQSAKDFPSSSVLDVGTGNGLLLQELAKQGFTDLTGTDYSEGTIDLLEALLIVTDSPISNLWWRDCKNSCKLR